MGNLKNTTQKFFFKKIINLNQSYNKEQKQRERERERESTNSFCVEKIWNEWNK